MWAKVTKFFKELRVGIFEVNPCVPADATLDALDEVDFRKPQLDALEKLWDMGSVFLTHTLWPEPAGPLGSKVFNCLWPAAIEYLSCKSIAWFVEHGPQDCEFLVFRELH